MDLMYIYYVKFFRLTVFKGGIRADIAVVGDLDSLDAFFRVARLDSALQNLGVYQ